MAARAWGPRDGTGREPVRVLLLSSCVSLGESRDPLTHLKSVRKGPACGRRYLNNAHHSYSPMRTAGLGVHSLVGILAVFRFSGSPTSVCISAPQMGSSKAGFWAPPPGALIPRSRWGLGMRDSQGLLPAGCVDAAGPGTHRGPRGRPRAQGADPQSEPAFPARARQSLGLPALVQARGRGRGSKVPGPRGSGRVRAIRLPAEARRVRGSGERAELGREQSPLPPTAWEGSWPRLGDLGSACELVRNDVQVSDFRCVSVRARACERV